MTNLQSWLSRLERLHPTEIELGLARVAEVARKLDVEKPAPVIVTVAGTNGKGSCVAVMEALLRASGRRVGAYTSPHLLRFNERVRIGGAEASDSELVRAFEAVEAARGDISLTYFEFTTLAALWLFREADVEYALLEVGLGGRLDAVNLVDADLAIITSVAIDHQDWLGSDRENIGREKAGILRPGSPVICADPEPPLSVVSAAAGLVAPSYFIGRDFSIEDSRYRFGELSVTVPPLSLPPTSVAAAITALSVLGALPEQNIAAALGEIQLPGRCQQLRWRDRSFWLDVGHNPAAAAYLARRLQKSPAAGETHALVAAMADKDLSGLFAPLRDLVDRWHPALLPGNARAADSSALLNALVCAEVPRAQVEASCLSVGDSLERLLVTTGPRDRLLVFGSFFTVAEVLQRIREEGDGESRP
ncbi:bifunctional tetrahydrofolate synthase/dihydrofolate synthase [Microbulbifer thermotolerans]|uniref:Dihydrofolate synthase/folylpolyglutamate synthase n=1 Tax=Microbulbifer thermotolerans TaxID=252514 RepID=A0A143HKE7_MICTH|nr:bifunctional tetrahydrofolate synthase/dihydrofolate synthase [Microbulbifer thermotolerans]AMX02143.1 bifunctional folylpolyglutamate synthase/ dihydrofolate synthase [Microbulbifer thermotolerans]SFB72760.1 dihydrofolate synthase / folylpolyglutamate synthase [Microbulbifer thermotolerans]